MAASRFSVGRKTIIKVYDELERRGLVVRRRGAGTAFAVSDLITPQTQFHKGFMVIIY